MEVMTSFLSSRNIVTDYKNDFKAFVDSYCSVMY